MPDPGEEYIGYRSWNKIRNSGDVIIPAVLKAITGINPKIVRQDQPHIIGLGSIMFLANENSVVWTTGVLHPGMPVPNALKSTFRALRGKVTYAHLKSLGLILPDLPLGDGGIFAADICQSLPLEDRKVKYRAAFVPHHGSIRHPFFEEVAKNPDFVLVDILDDGLTPIKQILQSEVVVSQSLHGLIYAESLGKPNVWVSDRDDAIWRFKFDDWYSTTLEPQLVPCTLGDNLEDILKRASLRGTAINKQDLATALPRGNVVSTSAQFMSYEACRRYNPVVIHLDVPALISSFGGDQLSDKYLQELTERIFPVVWRTFGNWSERVYCLLVPVGNAVNLDPEKIADALRFMDENPEFDYAFLTAKVNPDWPESSYLSHRGVIRFNKDHKIVSGAILLRPDSYQLSRNFVTIFI